MQTRNFISALILLASHSAVANTNTNTEAPRALFDEAVSYQGNLGYLDYRSGKNVAIPMALTFTPSADQKHLVVDKVFTDPGYKVYSLSVMRIDLDNGVLTETTFNKDTSTKETYDIVDFQFNDTQNWTLKRRAIRQDDNKDARVTITESLHAGVFSSETRVDYLATQVNENLKRNWVEARRAQ